STNGPFSGQGVSVFLGNGDGTFGPGIVYATGNCATGLDTADFNVDGILDMAVANYCNGDNSVTILLGNGDGTFAARHGYPVFNAPQALIIGDFNRDGSTDFAANSSNGPSVLTVWLNDGHGLFPTRIDSVITGQDSGFGHEVTKGDFNEDGNLDVAAGAGQYGTAVMLGNEDGSFMPPSFYPYGSYGANGVKAADLNGDGHMDLVASNRVLFGNGNGTFTPGPSTVGINAIALGDFNRDGYID